MVATAASKAVDRDIVWVRIPPLTPTYADVVEMVDAQDLGSCGENRTGSIPVVRTTIKTKGEDQ